MPEVYGKKKHQHAFVTFQVPPAPESAAEPTGEPRLPNPPKKANHTQCYSGCTYCTCHAYLPNLLPILIGRKPIQARVDTCLKAMNDRLVGIDTVMEPERRCNGKRNIQGRRRVVVNDNVWHCNFMIGAQCDCCRIRSECLDRWVE